MVPQWSMSMTALATFAWKTRIFLKDRTKSSCFQMQVLQVLFQSVKGVWKICLKGIWKSVCFLGFSWIQKHQKLFLLFFKFSLSDILVSKFILCCCISFLQINPSASPALLLTPRKPLLSKKIHSPLLPSTERKHQDSLPWWRWGAEGVPSSLSEMPEQQAQHCCCLELFPNPLWHSRSPARWASQHGAKHVQNTVTKPRLPELPLPKQSAWLTFHN